MIDSTTISAWISAGLAIVSPFAAVILADRLNREHNRNLQVVELFRQIVMHSHALRQEMLDMFQWSIKRKALSQQHAKLSRQESETSTNFSESPARDFYLRSLENNLNDTLIEIREMDTAFATAFKNARILDGQLNTDLYALQLLLGRKGLRCHNAICQLLSFLFDYKFSDAIDTGFDEFQESTYLLVKKVTDEVVSLQTAASIVEDLH